MLFAAVKALQCQYCGQVKMTNSHGPVRFCSQSCGAKARQARALPYTKERLNQRREIDPVTGCWLWRGANTPFGYGVTTYRNIKVYVHRLAACLYLDLPLEGPHKVLHRCDNPPCFNPEHLYQGTAADNTRDMLAKGRNNNGRIRLDPGRVRAIRAQRRLGASVQALARTFNASEGTIRAVVKGRTWRHIEDEANGIGTPLVGHTHVEGNVRATAADYAGEDVASS
jgi:hypothetical protein